MPIAVIAGLGNPGSQYRNTRHNIGYTLVDQLAKKYGATWKHEARFEAEVAVIQYEERKLMLLKPQTFMNASAALSEPCCATASSPLNQCLSFMTI